MVDRNGCVVFLLNCMAAVSVDALLHEEDKSNWVQSLEKFYFVHECRFHGAQVAVKRQHEEVGSLLPGDEVVRHGERQASVPIALSCQPPEEVFLTRAL